MNQLSGRYVNVVLTVEEGRGMESFKNHIGISANFNGRILESDSVNPSDSPSFNTELVWEIEKKDLRKIRSTNQPLRIECFTINQHNRKDRIGIILLSLRSAKIITPSETAPLVWQKFIGQHDKKSPQPELALSLTIQEHSVSTPTTEKMEENVTVMPYITEEDNETSDQSEYEDDNDTSPETPVKYLDDGFISIGETPLATEQFSLNILVRVCANLDLLLPEVLVFGETRKKFYLCFKIFGIIIKTKPFDKNLNDVMVMNEKIVVRLLSRAEVLIDYFRTQKIWISFCCGIEKLGLASVDLDKLSVSEDEKDMCVEEEMCYFKFPSPNGIVPSNGNMQPYINVATSLLKTKIGRRLTEDEGAKAMKKISSVTKCTNIEKASGDTGKTDSMFTLNKVEQKAQSDHKIPTKTVEDGKCTKSDESILKNCPLQLPKKLKPSGTMSTYKKYYLEVCFKNFTPLANLDTKCSFRILHPKAASCLLNVNPKDETLSSFRICYIGTDEQISTLLKAWPPKVCLTDRREQSLIKEHVLRTNIFHDEMPQPPNQKPSEATDSLFMHNYKIDLVGVKDDTVLASMEVVMALTESRLETHDDKTCLDLLPAVIDEEITIMEIIDLERWKAEEKILFEQKLHEMEKLENDKLKKDMKLKRQDMEEVLKKQVQKCKELQKDLQAKVNDFKTDKMLKKRRKSSTVAALDSIKEKTSKYAKCDQDLLLVVINRLEVDNNLLREIVNQQNEELRVYKKCALTKEQTTNLLQELRGLEEKFEQAQIAKGYFKSQWKKAFEEIHELKTEDYKQLQDQIRQNKEELSGFSLDTYEHGNYEGPNMCFNDGFRSNRTNTSVYSVFK